MVSRVRLEPAGFGEESSCYRGRIEMIAELEPPDHLGEADLNLEQSKAMVVGIDDPLAKPRISGSSPLPASSRSSSSLRRG